LVPEQITSKKEITTGKQRNGVPREEAKCVPTEPRKEKEGVTFAQG